MSSYEVVERVLALRALMGDSTEEELCEHLGISGSLISKWRHDQARPHPKHLRAIGDSVVLWLTTGRWADE